jgi:hypothetical protein
MNAHPTIIEAAKLLRQHWPTCSTWNDDQLLNWIGIFNKIRQLGIIKNEKGECIGVGAVRFLNSIEEAEDINNNFPDGHIAWVEMVIGVEPEAVQTLWLAMMTLCSRNVTKLGGFRKGVSRLYDFDRYFKLLMNRKISYGWNI